MFSFLSWLLPLAMNFVATPLIVHSLGKSEYGIYILIGGFISYSFTFNIGRAVTKYIAEYRATAQNEKIGEILSATLLINLVVGTFGGLVFIGLARWFAVDLLRVEPALQEKTIIGFYIASVCVWWAMLAQVYSAVLQAIQRFDLFSHTTTVTNFLLVLGNLILALNGFGVNTILAWNAATTAISCLLYYLMSRRLLPEARFTWKFSRETLILVAKYSAGVTAYQIISNLILLFERSWITRVLGAESLTFYSVPMTIGIYLHTFVTSLTLVFFPLTSELYAQNHTETLLNLYLRATKIICALVVFLGLTLAIGSREFLQNWVGSEFAAKSSKVMILQLAVFSLLAVLIVSWQLMEGIGFPGYNALLTVILLVVTITLMIMWTTDYGLVGASWARLLSVAIVPFSILWVERKIFGQPQWNFWLKITVSLALAGSFSAGAEYVLLKNIPTYQAFNLTLVEKIANWSGLLLSFAVSGIVYVLCLWLTAFANNEEKRWLGGFIKRAVA